MDIIPVMGGLVPTHQEVAALDALLENDPAQVGGLVDVAVSAAWAYLEDGEEIPEVLAAELAAVRRSGGVHVAVRRAGLRTQRRQARAEIRALTSVVSAETRTVVDAPTCTPMGGWAA